MSSDFNTKAITSGVNIQSCKFVWEVRSSKPNDILRSPGFNADNDSFKWFLRYHRRTYDDSEKSIGSSIQLVATSVDEIKNHGAYAGEVTFCVSTEKGNFSSEKGTFIVNEDIQHTSLEDNRFLYRFVPQPTRQISLYIVRYIFTLECHISFFKLNDAIPRLILEAKQNTLPIEVNVSNPLEDFGKLYLNEEHSDVTMCIKFEGKQSKEFPAHKIVLIVRSKVFEAMFKHDMKENKLNRVVVEGIKEEVFLEALRYIYTGHVQNLDTLVYELLPVADRYDLEKLRITCGNVLREKLSIKRALKIVMLADMHSVVDLKAEAVEFIKDHSDDVARRMKSKDWSDLMSRPHLMKDLLVANMIE